MSAVNPNQILEPIYVRNFQCIGERCPSNCCHSWSIALDKKNFKAMRKSNEPAIRALVKQHFKKLDADKATSGNYGVIRLDSQGRCPMLDGVGLCEIHKRLGGQALSVTCQQYPRVPQMFGARMELSLSLSCPAAAEEILFNPEAMILNVVPASAAHQSYYRVSGILATRLPLWAELLRDFSFEVMLLPEHSLSERLFILGLSYQQIDAHLDNPLEVERILSRYRQHIADGSLRNAFSALPELKGHKWKIFAHQVLGITSSIRKHKEVTQGLPPAEERFLEFQSPLIRQLGLALGLEGADLAALSASLHGAESGAGAGEAFDRLLARAREQHLNPFFANHPQVLLNYLLYQLYHNQFLLAQDKTPLQFFQVLMVDLLVIEGYLAGLALEQGQLDRELVVGLFSAYARKRQHSGSFIDNVERYLKQAVADPLAAVFGLLS